MNKGFWTAVAVVVPGGVLMAAGALYAAMWAAAGTGVEGLDRYAIRGNALLALFRVFGVKASPVKARAYVAGVLANEGAYNPKPDGTYPLGDVGHRLGPSVGPGQVLSGLHLARLGYVGDPLDLARVGNESSALYYSARIFKEAWDQGEKYFAGLGSEADVAAYAVQRYNGRGVMAMTYQSNALARISSLGGFAV